VKKTQGSKRITLNKETLLHLQTNSVELRDARVAGATGWCTGPSCDIYRYCTFADCATTGC